MQRLEGGGEALAHDVYKLAVDLLPVLRDTLQPQHCVLNNLARDDASRTMERSKPVLHRDY